MKTRSAIILFVAVFAFALVLLFPLGLALDLVGAGRAGLSARGTSGDVWTGQLTQARMGPVSLGDTRVGLKPLPLFIGRADIGGDSQIGFGHFVTAPTQAGMSGVTARLPLAAALAPLPLETLELIDAAVIFTGTQCTRGEGRVRAAFGGDVGGLALAQGMTGVMRCERDELVLPLVSTSAMERLTIRLKANGDWTGVLSVQPGDPAMAAKLTAAGFTTEAGAAVLRLAGRF